MCLVLTPSHRRALGRLAHVPAPMLCTGQVQKMNPISGEQLQSQLLQRSKGDFMLQSNESVQATAPKGGFKPIWSEQWSRKWKASASKQMKCRLQCLNVGACPCAPHARFLRSQDGADVGMFWAPPAGTESQAKPVLEQANRKMLKDLRTANKDSHHSPRITGTQGSSQPSNAPACPQVTHAANSFISTRTRIFFFRPRRPKTHSLNASPHLLAKQLACFPLAWYQSHWPLKPWYLARHCCGYKTSPQPGDLKEQPTLAHLYVNCCHSRRSLAAVEATPGPCSMLGDQLLHLQHHKEKGKANVAAI